MSRTKGSGWGGGPMYYQICPKCSKKKVLYDPIGYDIPPFKCTWCKERFHSNDLLTITYKDQLPKQK